MPKQNATRWKRWTKVRLKPDAIRRWRLHKQLSQGDAAKICEMSETTWRRCESGQLVQALTAARIAEKAGMDLAELRMK